MVSSSPKPLRNLRRPVRDDLPAGARDHRGIDEVRAGADEPACVAEATGVIGEDVRGAATAVRLADREIDQLSRLEARPGDGVGGAGNDARERRARPGRAPALAATAA